MVFNANQSKPLLPIYQQIYTYSKSTIETLEKDVKYVQS